MNKLGIVLNVPKPAIADALLEAGYTPVLLYDSYKSVDALKKRKGVEKFALSIPINFEKAKSELKILEKFVVSPESIVVALEDGYINFAATVAEYLNLDQKNHFNLELTKLCSNKLLQRKTFEKAAPEISVPFKKIKTFHGAYTFARKHGYPVVVKPASLAGSKLVTISENLENMVRDVSYALEYSAEIYKLNHVYKQPSIMVEGFIPGKLYSVDSLVDSNGKVHHTPPVREYLPSEVGLDEYSGLPITGLMFDYTKKEEQCMYSTVEKAIKAVGITSNVVHTEIKIDKNNCKVIELSARQGGGRTELLKLGFGIDFGKHLVEALSGQPITLKVPKPIQSVIRVNYLSKKAGKLLDLNGLGKVEAMDEFVETYDCSPSKIGVEVGPAHLGYRRVCGIVLADKDPKKALQAAKNVFDVFQPNVEEIQETEF